MAKKEDLDLDLTEEEESSGGKSKLLIIVIIAVLLVGGGVGSIFLLRSTGGGDGGAMDNKAEEAAGPIDANTMYLRMPNPVVVNLPGGKRGRILQLKIAFQLKSVSAEDAVKKHLPLLTNKMLALFSAQEPDKLSTLEEKQALKEEALTMLNETLKAKTESEEQQIEKLLFTSFVMQ